MAIRSSHIPPPAPFSWPEEKPCQWRWTSALGITLGHDQTHFLSGSVTVDPDKDPSKFIGLSDFYKVAQVPWTNPKVSICSRSQQYPRNVNQDGLRLFSEPPMGSQVWRSTPGHSEAKGLWKSLEMLLMARVGSGIHVIWTLPHDETLGTAT